MNDEITVQVDPSDKIISSGWRIFKDNIWTILLVIAVFLGLTFLFGMVIGVVAGLIIEKQRGLRLLGGLFGVVMYSLQYMVVASITEQAANGEKPSAVSAFKQAMKHLLPGTISGLLVSLAIIAGTVALILPGVYLSIRFVFAPMAVVLRGKGAVESIKYSSYLVKDRWWDAFGNVLYFGVIMMFPRMLFRILKIFIPETVVFNLTDYFISQLFSVFSMILISLLFIKWDCSRKKENEMQIKDIIPDHIADNNNF